MYKQPNASLPASLGCGHGHDAGCRHKKLMASRTVADGWP